MEALYIFILRHKEDGQYCLYSPYPSTLEAFDKSGITDDDSVWKLDEQIVKMP